MKRDKFKNIFTKHINEKIFLWSFLDGHIIKIELSSGTFNQHKKSLSFKITEDSHYYITEMIGGSGKLYFIMPSQSLIFSADLIAYEDLNLEVSMPMNHHFYERRLNERIVPEIPIIIEFEKNQDVFLKGCIDFSIEGISLPMMKADKFTSKEGDRISNLTIDFGHRKVKLDAEIVSIKDLKPFSDERFPYACKRISLKFHNVTDKQREFFRKIIDGHKKIMEDLKNY